MKVIVAGFCKTGTKTMNPALTELGYDVYDYLEHYMYHCNEWNKVADGEGTIEDFKKLHENVDSVVDAPALLYWYEIHQAFPDAKIILTTRDETLWFKSYSNQAKHTNEVFNNLVRMYSGSYQFNEGFLNSSKNTVGLSN